MDMEAARKALVQEARDLLSEMETALLRMEQDGFDEDSIHAVFRAAHTIKGSAGLFGLEGIVGFTHVLETILDEIRSGKLTPDASMISLFLESGDHLRTLIDNIEQNSPESADQLEEGRRLIGLLQPSRSRIGKSLVAPSPVVTPVEEITTGKDGVASEAWHISLRLAPDVLRAGMDPLSFFRYLSTMGEIEKIDTLDDALVGISSMDPEQLYLGFEIQFRSLATREAIESVFDFVAEGSTIRMVPPHGRVAEYLELIQALPEGPDRLGEILVSCGALTPSELCQMLEMQHRSKDPTPPVLGEILIEERIVPPVVVAAALKKQKATREKASQESRSVKVDVAKLDHLINLVGELVIAAAGAKLAAVQEKSVPCEEAVNGVSKLVEEIRDAALGVRMIPVGEVFNRFPRVVRDLAKDLGKKIDLVITGAETELDKSMVEKLVDPLMHIVRNAIDHGIEAVDKRLAAGKSEAGTIRLNAWHESGSILIEISDDGGGLNRERILEKALAVGLVQPGQELTDREVSRLIFEPGFSTADAITNLSGRGVGMDVVKRNIEALRGEIEVESRRGQGAAMRIRLPLTLAIIDGFQIMAGSAAYVVPLDLVKECADLDESNVHGHLVSLRGESMPFIRLRELFSIPGTKPARESLVVVQQGPNRLGIVVDQLAGELQAVIKPMGTLFRELKAIGGTTILGNGSVALILDVPHLSQVATRLTTYA